MQHKVSTPTTDIIIIPIPAVFPGSFGRVCEAYPLLDFRELSRPPTSGLAAFFVFLKIIFNNIIGGFHMLGMDFIVTLTVGSLVWAGIWSMGSLGKIIRDTGK